MRSRNAIRSFRTGPDLPNANAASPIRRQGTTALVQRDLLLERLLEMPMSRLPPEAALSGAEDERQHLSDGHVELERNAFAHFHLAR